MSYAGSLSADEFSLLSGHDDDYYGLWEVDWHFNGHRPEWSHEQRVAFVSATVERGYFDVFFGLLQSERPPLKVDAALKALADPTAWMPALRWSANRLLRDDERCWHRRSNVRSITAADHSILVVPARVCRARTRQAATPPLADIANESHNSGMDEDLRNKLLDLFDASPASVDEFRIIIRALVNHLSLNAEEAEIMAWDASGRKVADRDRLAARAWNFNETGVLAYRRRLFAGFVTNASPTDGYGADYLIDFALGAGISADDIYVAMLRVRPDGP